jgi:transposase InsO family protein
LCKEFGVSRTTGHKWIKRFKELGYAGLEEESRRPKSAPLATAEELVMAVLQARDAHPSWGPQKLRVLLARRFAEQTPSPRTIARILSRADRVRARRKRRPPNIVDRAPEVQASACNDVWTVDFKGWWKAANGERCEPLTVRDAFSRFVLAIVLCSTKTAAVRDVFERLFRQFGLPAAIQCDNGIPFVSVRSRGGLSALSAWWVSLGIRIVRSRPACPQDNGGHERMHRDLSSDVQTSPASDRTAQQRYLDKWRQEFNHVRPHQALHGKTPAELYTRSTRKPAAPFVYPVTLRVYRVGRGGSIRVQGELHWLSEALAGHCVGLSFVDAFHSRVWFHDMDLGLLETCPDVKDDAFLLTNHTQKCEPIETRTEH